jgi:hypothetical protein
MAEIDDNRTAAIAIAQDLTLNDSVRLKALRIVLVSDPSPAQKAVAIAAIQDIADTEASDNLTKLATMLTIIQDNSKDISTRLSAAEIAVTLGPTPTQITNALEKLRLLRDNTNLLGDYRVRAITLINKLLEL